MTPTPGPAPIPSVSRPITLWERRLLALLLALFLLRDLPWRLDEYDQAKQAFTSLEMIDGGAWWFQHTPGCRGLATKPPLVGWMSAAVYSLSGGNWEIAWRLPSLLATRVGGLCSGARANASGPAGAARWRRRRSASTS